MGEVASAFARRKFHAILPTKITILHLAVKCNCTKTPKGTVNKYVRCAILRVDQWQWEVQSRKAPLLEQQIQWLLAPVSLMWSGG